MLGFLICSNETLQKRNITVCTIQENADRRPIVIRVGSNSTITTSQIRPNKWAGATTATPQGKSHHISLLLSYTRTIEKHNQPPPGTICRAGVCIKSSAKTFATTTNPRATGLASKILGSSILVGTAISIVYSSPESWPSLVIHVTNQPLR